MELDRTLSFGKHHWLLCPLSPDGQELPNKNVKKAPAELNALGAQGWELVGTSTVLSSGLASVMILIFKRRKP